MLVDISPWLGAGTPDRSSSQGDWLGLSGYTSSNVHLVSQENVTSAGSTQLCVHTQEKKTKFSTSGKKDVTPEKVNILTKGQ